ncbi:gamma-glutamyl phosphate reductase [Commensalibacter intestini A911]|uniref:Gamma-glutamyl phosphate reductase n=2 Tax=Commensalibacter intestini TaxID=479936 RepID=A0A251ZSS3_9PROT|nr:glutamate-5-semialdehyde dehydrogenase [Commensalibacter intestini]EHD13006.1 gamma-glutamyl phosphate reductase [Commensalibacter intestini A911]OUI77720.1 gamma-glutamyl phosphate reductase [Commensalibacter intestini]
MAMVSVSSNSTLTITELAQKVRDAAYQLSRTDIQQRNQALRCAAKALRAAEAEILAVNADEVAKADVSSAFKDRMTLNHDRLEAMAKGLEDIAGLPDPLGKELASWDRPNGLKFKRVSVPLGVVGMIYESRPNVGADAVGICIKSGNGIVLRGGSETHLTSMAIHKAMQQGMSDAGLNPDSIAMPSDSDRRHVMEMLHAVGIIDVIIPRGGYSLIRFVQQEARVPVLAHAAGLCHTYIHQTADFEKARKVLANAKMRRTGICGATETLLIDESIAKELLPILVSDLQKLGCRFVGNAKASQIASEIELASDEDFATEWLDAVLSVAVVKDIEEVIQHIVKYGSGHTEAIIAEDEKAVRYFMDSVPSAVVMWNTSTQFCDGGEFGFGAEIGIATGRLHARGPVGIEQLTSYRYEVYGNGQVRS